MSFHSRSVANGLNGVLGMRDEVKVGAEALALCSAMLCGMQR